MSSFQQPQEHGEELLVGREVISSAFPNFHFEFLSGELANPQPWSFPGDGVNPLEEDVKGFATTPPGSPAGLSNGAAGAGSSNSKFPTGLAQKIGYLQMVVQMLGNNGGSSQSSNSQQIGKLVDQLLVTARGMFLEQQQQQQSVTNSVVDRYSFNFSPEEHVFQQQQQQQLLQQADFQPHNPAERMPANSIFPKLEATTPQYVTASTSLAIPASRPDGGGDEDESLLQENSLPPESYELIELDAMEILAEHTHFCEICGKGFKRDANLRMHMRGHGDEYKTPAALARPKGGGDEQGAAGRKRPGSPKFLLKRYSCPYLGCKRNKQHKKFVPLKTVLCVKNHYRRSHCPKILTCTRCRVKRFAVLADLKTHEKHCGREKWQCSCGTTFSRKDKLLGHISLFVGHKPLMMVAAAQPPPPIILPSSCSSSSFSAELSPVSIYSSSMQKIYSPPAAAAAGVVDSKSQMLGEVDGGGDPWNSSMFGGGGGGGGGGGAGILASSSNNNITGEQSSSLGYLSLDFFDCKN